MKTLADLLRHLWPILFRQPCRCFHVRVLHRDHVAALRRDVQLLLHLARPFGELERESEVRMVVVACNRVDTLTGGSRRCQVPFATRLRGIRQPIELVFNVFRVSADLLDESPVSLVIVSDGR